MTVAAADPASAPAPAAPRPAGRRVAWLRWGALAVGLLIAGPVIGVLSNLVRPGTAAARAASWLVLPDYLFNTAVMLGSVAVGTAVIGTGTAWLVATCRFPGRGFFEWALALPLAMPAYVLAWVYTDWLQFAGPVQGALRAAFGWSKGDYWFPDVYSLGGAATLFVLTLYPYVYLAARAGFIGQSMCPIDVGRTLGLGPWGAFFRVALPLARPAVVAGVALALMETLADYGAVAYFNVQTFTTGVYRAWFTFGDRAAAAQLASVLLATALFLLWIERASRRRQRFHSTSSKVRALPATPLRGWRLAGAWIACGLPTLLGFALPAALLLRLALEGGDTHFGPRYLTLARNSLVLACGAALLSVALAALIAYGARLARSRLVAFVALLAGLGYAAPGVIVAVGTLIPLAAFDNALDGWMRATFGVSTGLLLTGSIVALLYGFVVRFLAVALQNVEAGLSRITPSMDGAARTLGASAAESFRRVHRPLLAAPLLSAFLIVFVDAMKELPATLMMRPFNFDTLAVQAFNLARDERLAEASSAALAIVAVGLIPVILLSRAMRSGRPGHEG